MAERRGFADDPIGSHFIASCESVDASLRSQLGLVIVPREIVIGFRSAFQVGLEIGLAIGVADIVAARRMRNWLAEQGMDPGEADERAADYLRVLGS